jgi:GT2 family glycosyltransferase
MSKNCIVILNYNDSERVIDLVRHISGYNSLKQIVLVDNCSTDDSYEKLKKIENDKINVIQTEKNMGYAVGNNFGANYALEKWDVETLFFANPDVFFEEEVIITVENNLFLREEYGSATVLVKEGYNVWDLPKYWGTVRMLFMLSFTLHKRSIKKKLLKSKGIYAVGVVEGSFFAIKGTVFRKIGGFDERTFLYLEENILACRLQKHGYKTIVNTDMFYLHEHSKSISKEYKSKTRVFKFFKRSFSIYLTYYLYCSTIEKVVFDLFYMGAYLERIVYDIVKNLKQSN